MICNPLRSFALIVDILQMSCSIDSLIFKCKHAPLQLNTRFCQTAAVILSPRALKVFLPSSLVKVML